MSAVIRLCLTRFRNHSAIRLEPDPRPVCLYGANGAGKTNILEAISQLTPGRGLRGAGLADMVQHNAPQGWAVAAHLDSGHEVGVGMTMEGRHGKRLIRLNGETATVADLTGIVRIIWLTPAMDTLFRGGASERRRFLDRQVITHVPTHGVMVSRYERAMRERNALLETQAPDPVWLDAVEARMAETGAIIASNRARIIRLLQDTINESADSLFPKSDLALSGALAQMAAQNTDLREIGTYITRKLAEERNQDRAAGRTLSGPHRTDLEVIHRPDGIPSAQASTGQQKALLTGLVLASARALCANAQNPKPLILLDEAIAHLDLERRIALFEELIGFGTQAWLTGTEAALFDPFGTQAQKIKIGDQKS